MAEVTSAPAAAQDKQEDANPFAGFVTEEYVGGQRVEDPPQPKPADEPKEEPQPQDAAEGAEQGAQDPEAAQEGGEEAGGAPPKPKSVQERINEITRQRHDERRRAEAAEQRARELEAEIERIRTGGAQQDPAQPAKVEGTAAPKEGEPNPEDFEYGELDSRYIAALVAYNTKQAIAAAREEERQERERIAAETKQKERHTAFVKRAEEGAAKRHPDFVEKVFGGIDTYPMSQETAEVVLESPVGDEIAYHLATHIDEAWKLYQMPSLQQARYLGMLEARFSAAGSAAPAGSSAEEIPAKLPQAPAPVLPARGAGGKFTAGADTDDFAAFERRMNQG